jgi:hypothetical protein
MEPSKTSKICVASENNDGKQTGASPVGEDGAQTSVIDYQLIYVKNEISGSDLGINRQGLWGNRQFVGESST